MSIVSIEDARSHCRVDSDYPSEQLQPYVDGAEGAAAAYLNRYLYADASSLAAAQDSVAEAIGAASEAYATAKAAAAEMSNADAAAAALAVAESRWCAAKVDAARSTHGMVATPVIIAAIMLTIGSLFENRSDTVVGLPASALPTDAAGLLWPHRRVMMP